MSAGNSRKRTEFVSSILQVYSDSKQENVLGQFISKPASKQANEIILKYLREF
jgi:hypothetical protein